MMILYTDNVRHKNAIDYIMTNYDEYALILHDRDIDDQGNLKKSHYHVLLKFKNAKWNTSLAKELDIEENLIQQCKNVTSSLKYFIHYNDDNKYKYDISDMIGSDKLIKKLEKLISDGRDENEKSLELIDYIENFSGEISIIAFSKYCCSVGMWDVFRRASNIYLSIINQHNYDVLHKKRNNI